MASRPQQKMKDNFDEPVQSQKTSVFVIPANAGIQFWARSSWIPGHDRQKAGGHARNDGP